MAEDQDFQDYLEYQQYQASQQPESRLDESYIGRLKNNLVAAADAASLGLADEGAAAVRSILPGFQDYDSELAAIRGGEKDYQAVHPYQAMASSIIGGLATAPATPAIRGAQGVKSLANAAKVGATTGGVYGGLYGFGSGEDGFTSRLLNSGKTGALGAVTGGALGSAAYGAGAGLSSPTAQRLYKAFEGLDADQAGAINPKNVSRAAPETPPAEYLYLAKRMRDIPTEDVYQGEQNLGVAAAENSPMFLPESVPSPSVTRLARFLSGNESSMDIMQNAVADRKAGALERVSGILDEVSPERSAPVAGRGVQTSIKQVQKTLEQERSTAAKPLYDALRKSGPFESDEVSAAVSNPRVKDAIKQVRKIFPEFDDQPDTGFDILDKAKQWLYSEAEGSTNKAEKRFIKQVQKKLTSAMDSEKVDYPKARKVYAEDSTPLDDLFGEKGKPMVDLLRRKPEHVGKTLLGFDYTKQLPELVKAVGEDGAQAIKDSVRAALQGKIETKRETANLVADIVQVPAMRERLKVVIGDDVKFERLMRLLGRENKYAVAANNYNPGSSTHGNFSEEQLMREGVSKLAKAIKTVRNPTAAVDAWFMKRGLPDELSRKLANVLVDQPTGLDFYQKMGPYIAQQQYSAAIGQRAGELAGGTSGIAAPFVKRTTTEQ